MPEFYNDDEIRAINEAWESTMRLLATGYVGAVADGTPEVPRRSGQQLPVGSRTAPYVDRSQLCNRWKDMRFEPGEPTHPQTRIVELLRAMAYRDKSGLTGKIAKTLAGPESDSIARNPELLAAIKTQADIAIAAHDAAVLRSEE